MWEDCPNCGAKEVPLYYHPVGDGYWSVVHCGCYWEAEPDEVECHWTVNEPAED